MLEDRNLGAGGTLYCLCRLAEPDGMIVSIDLPNGDFGGGCTEERVDEMRMLFPRDDQAAAPSP